MSVHLWVMKSLGMARFHRISIGLLLAVSSVAALDETAAIHVSPTGDDRNSGTPDLPLATIERARAVVRGLDRGAYQGIHVVLHAGRYCLPRCLELDPSDSGTSECPVVYRGAGDGEVVISGGVELAVAWQEEREGLFRARVPDGVRPFDQLFVNGRRMQLARYPNWEPGRMVSSEVAPGTVDPGWHNRDSPVFGGTAADALSPKRVSAWRDPVGAYVHALHAARWGSKHYEITGIDANGNVRLRGGWQENRGGGFDPFFRGGYHKELLFVENVREELDAPGEWSHERATRTLWFRPPVDIDLSTARLMAPQLRQLVVARGTLLNPVAHVRFSGLTFRHTRRVFMEPYERLLRGDWSIARLAAVHFEGATDCAVRDCEFNRLGGNGVFLSRFNRRVDVVSSRFHDLGESAVCLVGDMGAVRSPAVEYRNTVPPEEVDLTPGPGNPNYPAQCRVHDNLMYDLGLVGKQTAGVFISMAESITVSHNTIFRIPRAAICINDGTWGGHLIEHNDAFDTVRETGDHGPFNSWGRDRHWETPGSFGISSDPARAKARSRLDNWKPTEIRFNRFAHSKGHSWGIDLDDGTSNYRVHHNLCLGMGVKLREGFYRTVENNVIVNGFGGFHVWYDDCEDVIRRNLFVGDKPYRFIRANPENARLFDDNLFWNDGRPITVTGLGKPMGIAEWRGRGFDVHSVVADPGFVDAANGDYRVREGSPALELGFRNFAMDRFGVEKPEFRRIVAGIPRKFRTAAPSPGPERNSHRYSWLGAKIKNLTGEGEKSATGMDDERGILIVGLPERARASEAGFRLNDVILEVNGERVDEMESFVAAVASSALPRSIEVKVFRDQEEVIVKADRIPPDRPALAELPDPSRR